MNQRTLNLNGDAAESHPWRRPQLYDASIKRLICDHSELALTYDAK